MTRATAAERARIVGVDLARALAVLGMFASHVGPDPEAGGVNTILHAASGRASALFAFLAGVSLVLMSGRERLRGLGRAQAAVVTRVVIRAALLVPLGLWLGDLDTGVLVIIAFYGLYFLLAWPALWLRTRTLVIVAAGWAVAGPVLSYMLRKSMGVGDVAFGAPGFDDHAGPGDLFETLFLTGSYPALTWLPFVLAGMAVGRCRLTDPRVQRAMVGIGSGLAVLGYGGSWVVVNVLGSGTRIAREAGPQGVHDAIHARVGSVPVSDPAWLTVAESHTGTPFEIVGATGVALALLGLALLGCRAWIGRIVLDPLISVGAMALTVYTAHLIVLDRWLQVGHSWERLAGFWITALLLCWIWRHTLRRGPMEAALHVLSAAPARLVRGPGEVGARSRFRTRTRTRTRIRRNDLGVEEVEPPISAR
ncbi:DUF418 domain-containing protein [Streptomyces sp. SID3343]|uniref:DUF418 domain-containing protein n=1 Tax=Streptomyces sp. SID3343 TaxID=2690260 RepID=UPI00136AD9AE|nr:DUF418 domain-containing protein [Streptomyces sp. SID3343]MYW02867.1 DUF418 domain-containing protein [Streptomyces sp. SID3343]